MWLYKSVDCDLLLKVKEHGTSFSAWTIASLPLSWTGLGWPNPWFFYVLLLFHEPFSSTEVALIGFLPPRPSNFLDLK
jgi:hypothetical protein